ncbi:hypothetical protein JOL62DRAFT_211171 [Phyllosticta paracitricarpa]|uniref:Uncharacterized protein n=1 Tax=Phyllosticta paracitricarpa TaxID=2016321 RepID=A0ABR1N3D4_9PEZI
MPVRTGPRWMPSKKKKKKSRAVACRYFHLGSFFGFATFPRSHFSPIASTSNGSSHKHGVALGPARPVSQHRKTHSGRRREGAASCCAMPFLLGRPTAGISSHVHGREPRGTTPARPPGQISSWYALLACASWGHGDHSSGLALAWLRSFSAAWACRRAHPPPLSLAWTMMGTTFLCQAM